MDGWITNNLIVHSGRPGHEAKVYLLRVDDGRLKPLFDMFTTKAVYCPSPDGSLLAFDEYDHTSETHTLRIIAPDGSNLHNLASFKTTIYPVVWSPDGTSLAFAVYGTDNPSQSVVYVINRDGRGLEQVYGEAAIQSLVFSPDGQFLLVENGDQQRIFVVDLNSLKSHLLLAPGLSLTDWWREPAWVR